MADPAVEAAKRADIDDFGYPVLWDSSRDAMEEAAREALRPIREKHRPVYPVFSYAGGLQLFDPCPDCDGKAGVHPCGCWAETDIEYRCQTCRDEKGHLVDWPCADALDAYTTEELER